jgi:type VII secretion-associated serine protease mycosin
MVMAVIAGMATAGGAVPAVAHPAPPPRVAPAPRLAPAQCGPRVTDPLAEPPWPLARLRPELAWPLSRGAGVTVAVIDSGVSANHPALAGKVLPGADHILPGGHGDCDEAGHGTLIAGIIAGAETVSAGFRFHGVAPEARILPIRVLRDQRRSFEVDMSARIAASIRWAVDSGGADVINLSLTTPDTPQLAAAVKYAQQKRAVVVAAAGNSGGESGQAGQAVYPAAYDGVIAVAGIDQDEKRVSSSSAGEYVDIAAPGDRITGPAPVGDGYLFTEEGGTSFAAAYVSGVAALIKAYNPDQSPRQIAARITETADHPAGLWNPEVGYGVVNPARAVSALRLSTREASGDEARIAPPQPPVDPLGRVTSAAGFIALGGAVVALVLLIAVPVARRGRRRRWRAGRLTG